MRRCFHLFPVGVVVLLLASMAAAESKKAQGAAQEQPSASDQVADRIFYQEAKLGENLRNYTPLVETYIQNLKPDSDLESVPKNDAYFLGRLSLLNGISEKTYSDKTGWRSRVFGRLNAFSMKYIPVGFAQLIYIPAFDKANYDLRYVRQQFLGEVRTLIFDVLPKKGVKGAHFLGRIWVEDKDYNIVRINGTYSPQSPASYYFHFDSWRLNLQPGVWLPTYVYTEESDSKYAFFRKLRMKGQTRIWGYSLKDPSRQSEFTNLQVESPETEVQDQSSRAPNEFNPVESQHAWQREAEDNVLERLEKAGLLGPDANVTKVLQTVVNNIEITNNVNVQPEVRCRVLLTTPLESFTIGHTIVISRGLLDVLPDEASLAMVLTHELAHIVLDHRLDTRYAFSDRMIFPDEQSFRQIAVRRDEAEEDAADKKGVELLRNSPYKDKLGNAGLFLRALENQADELSWLISPHFGNRMAKGSSVLRMEALMQSAPKLEIKNVNQLAALPLGSRIQLDPWSDAVNMKQSKPVALYSIKDKLAFEITPVIPNLARFKAPEEVAKNASR